MNGLPLFTTHDQRYTLLGYWSHLRRSAEVSLIIYSNDPYTPASTLAGCQRAIAEADGMIAALEEYGVERWQATNHADTRLFRKAA